MNHTKIQDIVQVKDRIRDFQSKGKKVVLCYGMFNVLHIGHIRYLKHAQEFGDILVVVLTPDDKNNFGPESTPSSMRAEALAHLGWVDSIAVNNHLNWREMIRQLKPGVYAKGFESAQADNSFEDGKEEQRFFSSLNIRSVVVREDSFSSTGQINRYLSNYSEEVLNYVRLFKERYATEDIIESLERISGLRVTVIGDTIIDEYQYCTAIGKSSKDPMLALKFENKDLFAGGVLAIANQVACFAERVDLITILGEIDSHEKFIRQKLDPRITPHFVFRPGAPTLMKTRFVDGYSTNKLLEVYTMDDSLLRDEQDATLCRRVAEKIKAVDLVIVADYGHEALTRNLISLLSKTTCHLAVNTQSNAGNRGFNTISKYPRADFVSLAEHEIRLETRDSVGRLFPMMKSLAQSLSCRHFVVTRGKRGCIIYDSDAGLIQVPGFTQNVVDRVGAGDAFFAITSLCSALNVSSEILGFIGNVTGALAVETMGNEKPIVRLQMRRYIESLLR